MPSLSALSVRKRWRETGNRADRTPAPRVRRPDSEHIQHVNATRDQAGNLIVTNSERLIRVLLAAFLVAILGVWMAHAPIKEAVGWTAVCAIFGLALLAANERASFVFDREAAVVRWRQDTVFRHDSGEIPFAAITGLSLERDFNRSRRGGARRLVILTAGGATPVTTAFSGVGRSNEDVGLAVQSYLKELAPGKEVPFTRY
jgi:hypothetical protein